MNSNDFTKCLLWKNVKNVFSISCLTAPLCDLFVSELHLLLGLTGTHTRPGRMSLCAGVQFLLWIFYTVCVFFFRVWMCACRTFVTVCHSMWIEATSVLVCVCATAREKKRSVKTPPLNFRRVFELVLVEEKHYGCQIMTEERQRGTKLKEHSDFPDCSRFCCFTTITSHFV